MNTPPIKPDAWATARVLPSSNIEDIENAQVIELNAFGRGAAADESEALEWGDPQPVIEQALPMLPASLQDSPLGAIASTVSASLQVPIDYTFMVALGVTSAATRNHFMLEIDGERRHQESLSIYALPILVSGSNKTSSMSLVAEPLRAWDRQNRDDYYTSGLHYDHEIAVAQLEQIRSELKRSGKSKTSEGTDNDPRAALEAALMRVSELEEPESMLVDDTTPEALVDKMVRVGPVALIASEGGFISNLAGRYSNDTNLDGALKAHDGKEEISVERKGARQVRVPRPFLSLVLGVQPSVLREIRDNRQMMDRGFLARFLITLPDSLLGKRVKDAPVLQSHIVEEWRWSILNILNIDHPQRVIPFTPDALKLFSELRYDEVEPRLDCTGDIGTSYAFQAWGSKLPGQLARIAGLLALAEDPHITAITRSHLERVAPAADYFIEHSRRAHGSRTSSRPAQLLTYLASNSEDIENVSRVFSTREVHQAIKGQAWARKADAVREALFTLADMGWIRPLSSDHAGPGRPSELWTPHPRLIELHK